MAGRSLGLGISLALGVIALLRLPCLSGGCEAVWASAWAQPLGVPLGFYGAATWLVALTGTLRWRVAAHHVLAAGSIGLVAVQVLLIGKLCPWCLAHALVCWLAWPGRLMASSRRWLWPGVLVAAALVVWQIAARPVPQAVPTAPALVAEAFAWLTPAGAKPKAVLVVDLSCPVCLKVLAELAAEPQKFTGGLVFQTEGPVRALTTVFTASVQNHPVGAKDSFPVLLAQLLAQQALVLAQPEQAAEWWQAMFPTAASVRQLAETQLARQRALLQAAHLVTSPLLISAQGGVMPITELAGWPSDGGATVEPR